MRSSTRRSQSRKEKSKPEKRKRVIGEKSKWISPLASTGRKEKLAPIGPPVNIFVEQVSIATKWTIFETVLLDNALPEVLNEAGRLGMEVSEIFNPPDALHLDSARTHTNVQIFMHMSKTRGPIQFCTKTLVSKDASTQHREMTDMVARYGAQSYHLAGTYHPPDTRPSWDSRSHPTIQLIFQRPFLSPSVIPPAVLYRSCVLDVVANQTSTEIVDLSPTLNSLASQGFSLAAAINPGSARILQAKGVPSQIHFFFEKIQGENSPVLSSTVVKCQMTVTNFAFGTKVKGDYVSVIREYAAAGWTLQALIDIPDCVVSGLSTIFLVFQAPTPDQSQDAPAVPGVLQPDKRVDNPKNGPTHPESGETTCASDAAPRDLAAFKNGRVNISAATRDARQPATPTYMYAHNFTSPVDVQDIDIIEEKPACHCGCVIS